ncbi:unnamed protein product [Discosporangium mesarthrocarpum]
MGVRSLLVFLSLGFSTASSDLPYPIENWTRSLQQARCGDSVSITTSSVPTIAGCYEGGQYSNDFNEFGVFTSTEVEEDGDGLITAITGDWPDRQFEPRWIIGKVSPTATGAVVVKEVTCMSKSEYWSTPHPTLVVDWICDTNGDGTATPEEAGDFTEVDCLCETALCSLKIESESFASSSGCYNGKPNWNDKHGWLREDNKAQIEWREPASYSFGNSHWAVVWFSGTEPMVSCFSATDVQDPSIIPTEEWFCDGEDEDSNYTHEERGDFEGVECLGSGTCALSDSIDGEGGIGGSSADGGGGAAEEAAVFFLSPVVLGIMGAVLALVLFCCAVWFFGHSKKGDKGHDATMEKRKPTAPVPVATDSDPSPFNPWGNRPPPC